MLNREKRHFLSICTLLFVALLQLTLSLNAQQSAALKPLGHFTQIHQDAEHCSGYSIDLWRSGQKLFGLLRSCSGVVGDSVSATLEDVSYNPANGAFSFTTRLSQGSDYLGGGRQVPSQDVLSFHGRMTTQRLTGSLTHADRVYDKGATTSQISLRRTPAKLKTYQSEDEWRTAESANKPR